MKASTTGLEFLRFYNDKKVWGDRETGYYAEDMGLIINGVGDVRLQGILFGEDLEFLQDDDDVIVVGGYIVPQSGEREDTPFGCGSFDFVKVFLAWKQQQISTSKPIKIG